MNIMFKEDENGKKIISLDEKYGEHLDTFCGVFNFKENNECDLATFAHFLNMLSNRLLISRDFMVKNCDYMLDEFDFIVDEFNRIDFDIESVLNKYSLSNVDNGNFKLNYISDFLTNCDDASVIQRLIVLLKKMIRFQISVYKSLEFADFEDDLFEDLATVAPQHIVQKYRDKYDEMLQAEPFSVNKMELLYREIQKLILDDFRNRITPVDNYRSGDIFRFLCCKVDTVNSKDNYVDASLVTEGLLSNFTNFYGFIVNPKYIVSMDPSDLNIKTSARDDSDLSLYSFLPKIMSMGRLILETDKQNEIALKNAPFDDLFLGIYCITDGSKELNENYIDAYALKKDFPNLPVVDIDVTRYLTFDDMSSSRNALVDTIMEALEITTPIVDYDLYEPFWQEYLQLKQYEDYNVVDILCLFTRHEQLIEANTQAKAK